MNRFFKLVEIFENEISATEAFIACSKNSIQFYENSKKEKIHPDFVARDSQGTVAVFNLREVFNLKSRCETCNGIGNIIARSHGDEDEPSVNRIENCPDCNGSGITNAKKTF